MNTKTEEARIRALIDDWVDAIVRRDVPRILALYTADVESFDAIGPLRIRGSEAWAAHWRMCMEQCPASLQFRVQDVHVEADGNVGFARFLMQCSGTMPDGTTHSGWMRCTAGYRCEDGQWRIAHDHCSAPFDPKTNKALVDLQP